MNNVHPFADFTMELCEELLAYVATSSRQGKTTLEGEVESTEVSTIYDVEVRQLVAQAKE